MRTDDRLDPKLRASEVWKGDVFAEYTVEDLLRTNVPPGFSFSGGERNHLFISRHGEQFDDLALVSGVDSPGDSRSAAMCDVDRDGWVDMVVINKTRPTVNIYRNQIATTAPEHARQAGFVALRFVGGNRTSKPSSQFSNRDGFGAAVRLRCGDSVLLREHRCGEGFAAQNSSTMLIGIGTARQVAELAVRWPSGIEARLAAVPAGTLVACYENPADAPGQQPFVQTPYRRPLVETEPQAAALAARQPGAAAAVGGPHRLELDARTAGAQRASRLRMYTTMASWCDACKRYLPRLAALRSRLESSTLAMYGVPADPNDGPQELSLYREKYQPAYELLTDVSPEERAEVERILFEALKIEKALPATIVATGDGRVLLAVAGVPSLSELRKLLAKSAVNP